MKFSVSGIHYLESGGHYHQHWHGHRSSAETQKVAQTISSKFSTFADGADGYATAAQDTPGFGDADALSIMSAMDQLVPANQELLENMISQHGVFQQADATDPIAAVLQVVQGLVEAIGMALMQLVPTQNSAVQEAQDSLGGSLEKAVAAYQ
ncbi:hypothetical protein B0H13DRAFT_2341016 [Mycena leptocephala]|nr:hypothetical protein B0H13DRAFT_2341016 [Mycena leptocephala]